jgi:hypothetical protein
MTTEPPVADGLVATNPVPCVNGAAIATPVARVAPVVTRILCARFKSTPGFGVHVATVFEPLMLGAELAMAMQLAKPSSETWTVPVQAPALVCAVRDVGSIGVEKLTAMIEETTALEPSAGAVAVTVGGGETTPPSESASAASTPLESGLESLAESAGGAPSVASGRLESVVASVESAEASASDVASAASVGATESAIVESGAMNVSGTFVSSGGVVVSGAPVSWGVVSPSAPSVLVAS